MLQIVNGGVLPDGWTVDTLLSSHRSMPYNPDIANTFFRAGEVEAWGRGIERIIKGCNEDGFSTVDFRYDACGLWTTFSYQYPARVVGHEENIQKTTPTTTLTGHEITPSTTLIGQDNTTPHNVLLSDIQKHIIDYLILNPKANRRDIANNIKEITEDGVKYHLKVLKEKGVINHIGPRFGGYWQVLVSI